MSTAMLDYGRWRSLQGYGAFAAKREVPLFVQFSGGRTSAFMAAMAPDEATFMFQNTGREHEKTLEFVQRWSDATKREVVWLEFEDPKVMGDAPKYFRWKRVDFASANRTGEPLAKMMRAINAYRKVCGNEPIAPWVKSRICTVHTKHRVSDHWIKDHVGRVAHDKWVGLRADEPDRVAGLRRQSTHRVRLDAPLSEAGIVKADVLEFWSRQSFDLGLEEYEGNCDGCFLKDQGDVARAIGGRPEAIAWWGGMGDAYPQFGGRDFVGYRELAAELPVRLAIEKALREGGAPEDVGSVNPRRFRLLVVQERKRIEHGPKQFSCNCEGSMEPDDEEEDEEDEPMMGQMSLGLSASHALSAYTSATRGE